MAKKQRQTGLIQNRRASFDYSLKDRYNAGIVLSGPEVSSLRQGHGHLRGAYCMVQNGEIWLINATVTATRNNQAHHGEEKQTRNRKLLVKKRELKDLVAAKDQGLNIIPLSFQTGKRFIKVEIATAASKKHYDKRETIKKRDTERDEQRHF